MLTELASHNLPPLYMLEDEGTPTEVAVDTPASLRACDDAGSASLAEDSEAEDSDAGPLWEMPWLPLWRQLRSWGWHQDVGMPTPEYARPGAPRPGREVVRAGYREEHVHYFTSERAVREFLMTARIDGVARTGRMGEEEDWRGGAPVAGADDESPRACDTVVTDGDTCAASVAPDDSDETRGAAAVAVPPGLVDRRKVATEVRSVNSTVWVLHHTVSAAAHNIGVAPATLSNYLNRSRGSARVPGVDPINGHLARRVVGHGDGSGEATPHTDNDEEDEEEAPSVQARVVTPPTGAASARRFAAAAGARLARAPHDAVTGDRGPLPDEEDAAVAPAAASAAAVTPVPAPAPMLAPTPMLVCAPAPAPRESTPTAEADACRRLREIEEHFQCSICLDGFADARRLGAGGVGAEFDVVLVMPCQHAFHRGCIQRWEREQRYQKCPKCRGPIASVRCNPRVSNPLLNSIVDVLARGPPAPPPAVPLLAASPALGSESDDDVVIVDVKHTAIVEAAPAAAAPASPPRIVSLGARDQRREESEAAALGGGLLAPRPAPRPIEVHVQAGSVVEAARDAARSTAPRVLAAPITGADLEAATLRAKSKRPREEGTLDPSNGSRPVLAEEGDASASPAFVEREVVRCTHDILAKARDSLKAVELANNVRARVGAETFSRVRKEHGGLLSLLERHPQTFAVRRRSAHKVDSVALVVSPTLCAVAAPRGRNSSNTVGRAPPIVLPSKQFIQRLCEWLRARGGLVPLTSLGDFYRANPDVAAFKDEVMVGYGGWRSFCAHEITRGQLVVHLSFPGPAFIGLAGYSRTDLASGAGTVVGSARKRPGEAHDELNAHAVKAKRQTEPASDSNAAAHPYHYPSMQSCFVFLCWMGERRDVHKWTRKKEQLQSFFEQLRAQHSSMLTCSFATTLWRLSKSEYVTVRDGSTLTWNNARVTDALAEMPARFRCSASCATKPSPRAARVDVAW